MNLDFLGIGNVKEGVGNTTESYTYSECKDWGLAE